MKEIICIVCPRGCHLQVDETTLTVTGNHCQRGAEYGPQELLAPTRVLTSTIRICGSHVVRRCPVKTNGAIPKERMREAAKALDAVCVDAPICSGQVILDNFLGTGVDLIATRTIKD